MISERSKKIKKLMIDAEISAAEIGRRLGISRVAVIGVINGNWTSRRVQRAIAEALGVPYKELWDNNHGKKAA